MDKYLDNWRAPSASHDRYPSPRPPWRPAHSSSPDTAIPFGSAAKGRGTGWGRACAHGHATLSASPRPRGAQIVRAAVPQVTPRGPSLPESRPVEECPLEPGVPGREHSLHWLFPKWVIEGRGEASARGADAGSSPPGPHFSGPSPHLGDAEPHNEWLLDWAGVPGSSGKSQTSVWKVPQGHSSESGQVAAGE